MAGVLSSGVSKPGTGDIEGVTAGDGITGGGTEGTVTVAVDLGTNSGLEISSNKLQIAKGISQHDTAQFAAGVVDDDFLRIDGTTVEGRSASEVLSDISAAPAAGSSNIVTTGALDSGSITSGFGNIDTGSSTITTTGAVSTGSLTNTGDLTVDTNTLFVDASANAVGFGALTPSAPITTNQTADAAGIVMEYNTGANEYAPRFEFRKSRGSSEGSTTIVASGDELGRFNWQGYDGTNPINAAYIRSYVDGTPGTNDMPGRLSFWTTADGSASPTERMTIKSDGSIGIATATPGAGSVTMAIDLQMAAGSDIIQESGNDMNFKVSVNRDIIFSDTAEIARFVGAGGYLGIGTTVPDVQFHVEAGTDTTTGTLPSARFERTGASQTGVVLRSNSIDGLILRADSAGFGAIHSYEDLGFYTGATPGSSYGTVRMRIDSATGNIGIGTASPSELLHLYSSAGLSIALQSTHSNIQNTFDITVSDPSGQAGTTAGSGIAFSSDQCDRGLFFRQDGHVGIGTTAPTQKLDVYAAYNGMPIMTMCNTSVCGRGLLVSAGCGCSDQYLMRIQNIANGSVLQFTGDGKLGIGTQSPTYRAHVFGDTSTWLSEFRNSHSSSPNGLTLYWPCAAPDNNSNVFLNAQDCSAVRTKIYADGDVWTSDAGTLTSDERLKTNIVDASDKLADVMRIKVRNFEWIPDYHPAKVGEKKIGFIAQELEEVFPSLVSEHDIAPDNSVQQELYTEEDDTQYYVDGDDIPDGKEIGDVKAESQIPEGKEIGDVKVKAKAHEPTMRKSYKNAFGPILVKALQEVTTRLEAAEATIAALEAAQHEIDSGD